MVQEASPRGEVGFAKLRCAQKVSMRMTRGLKRGSVQRTGIEPRRSPANFEQVAQDPAYLRGVGDERDELHSLSHTVDRAWGSRCPLRGQLPPTRSTSYTFAISLAQADRQAACGHRGGLRGVGLRKHWVHVGLAPPPGSSAQDVGPRLPPCLAP